MRLIIKSLGIYQIILGLLTSVSLLFNVKIFLSNYDVFNLLLFISILLVYINSGWMILYYSKIGILLSIFIQALQITSFPGIKLYHNIMLAPSFYLTWANSLNIKYPVSLSSFSTYATYSPHINLTSICWIIILVL